jgi:hypothetical protein
MSSSCGNNVGVAATPNNRCAIAALDVPCVSSSSYAMSASRNALAIASNFVVVIFCLACVGVVI